MRLTCNRAWFDPREHRGPPCPGMAAPWRFHFLHFVTLDAPAAQEFRAVQGNSHLVREGDSEGDSGACGPVPGGAGRKGAGAAHPPA